MGRNLKKWGGDGTATVATLVCQSVTLVFPSYGTMAPVWRCSNLCFSFLSSPSFLFSYFTTNWMVFHIFLRSVLTAIESVFLHWNEFHNFFFALSNEKGFACNGINCKVSISSSSAFWLFQTYFIGPFGEKSKDVKKEEEECLAWGNSFVLTVATLLVIFNVAECNVNSRKEIRDWKTLCGRVWI